MLTSVFVGAIVPVVLLLDPQPVKSKTLGGPAVVSGVVVVVVVLEVVDELVVVELEVVDELVDELAGVELVVVVN